jgi:diacylglycerol kinase family enzyme
MRVLVLLNGAAGTLAASARQDETERIIRRFARHGVEAIVRPVPGDHLHAATSEARDNGTYDVIFAGGGDGTLNTVAGALVGSDIPFGVLPLGTFNHLAKELGIPLDLDEAIDALVAGRDEPFNLGQVNEQYFLLFMSIGIYSDMVRHRDAQRKVLGRKKMWAGTIAFGKMLFRWPMMKVTLRDIDPMTPYASMTRRTAIVTVSMSGYQLQQMGLTDAPRDIRQTLSVLVSPHHTRSKIVWVMLKGLFNRATLAKDLELLRVTSVTIVPHRKATVRVGYDGEVRTMETPLRVKLVAGGLKMRMPEKKEPTIDTDAHRAEKAVSS